MANTSNPKHIKIEGPELEKMKVKCDELRQLMEAADSDVAYQGFRRAWRVLSQYYTKGQEEFQRVVEAEVRKASQEKRAARLGHNSKAS